MLLSNVLNVLVMYFRILDVCLMLFSRTNKVVIVLIIDNRDILVGVPINILSNKSSFMETPDI